MTSEKVDRYRMQEQGELLEGYLESNIVICYTKITNDMSYESKIKVNNGGEFLVLPFETVEFDLEKHGYITSVQTLDGSEIKDNYNFIVEVGYKYRIV